MKISEIIKELNLTVLTGGDFSCLTHWDNQFKVKNAVFRKISRDFLVSLKMCGSQKC